MIWSLLLILISSDNDGIHFGQLCTFNCKVEWGDHWKFWGVQSRIWRQSLLICWSTIILTRQSTVAQKDISHAQRIFQYLDVPRRIQWRPQKVLKTSDCQRYQISWLKLYLRIQPIHHMHSDIVKAVVNKYTCLKEPGSFWGYYGWQQSPKY